MLGASRVLFVTMPWATPVHPSLGIGLLSAILARTGIASEVLHGNLLLPRARRPTLYGLADPTLYDDRSAGLSFVPWLYPQATPEKIAATIAERYVRLMSRDGHLPGVAAALDWRRGGRRWEGLIAQTLEDIQHARVCLERCMEVVETGRHDVIGFSLTFETQLVASLALARAIKERWPERRVVFGGAACASAQGESMLRSFPWLDAVCLGEGDPIIEALVRALRGEAKLADVPGIAFRDGDEVRITARLPPMPDLDWLPVPDYGSFVAQKAASEWADTRTALMFETSRGCWWGQKHLCTFCGLNAEALVYRSKSPDRVLEELGTLRRQYDLSGGLQAVDNILDTRYFSELIPKLAAQQQERRVPIFFEVKSNVQPWQFFELSRAGLTSLQPGIESFSDHILALMQKGASAFQQIAFIKRAQQVGIDPAYNLLLRNPGETAEDYHEMTALVPFIGHLQPPNGVANVELERFSPYFLRPADYGIRNVRPKPHYREMFPDDHVDLASLVYQFDFDHDALDAPELLAARRAFLDAVAVWQAEYRPHKLIYFVIDDEILVADDRGDRGSRGGPRRVRLGGDEARLYLELDGGRSFAQLREHFPALGEEGLRRALDRLTAERWAWRAPRKEAWIALAVRVYRTMDELQAHYAAQRAGASAGRERRRVASRSSARLSVIDRRDDERGGRSAAPSADRTCG